MRRVGRIVRRAGRRAWLLGGAGLLLAAPSAEPCSICRCGDPTFNALGPSGYARPGLRMALDWERFDKQEGPPAEDAEELVENRFTLLASYGFSDSFSLNARVPVSFRSFEEIAGNEVENAYDTSGLSDPELYGQLRLWASPLNSPLGRRSAITLLAGVKTALGQNDYQVDGERADEHAQPGTGSTDLFGSLAGLHQIDARSALFSSVQYRHNGENDYGYRYGSVFTANLAYEHKLTGTLDSVLELNYRYAGRDQQDGQDTDNTGGSVLYLTPRLLLDVGGGVVLRAAVQIPIVRDLYGVQKEKAVYNVGVSFLLGSN
jgi:Putative MetA-pathway of phenol degradation